MSRIIFLDIDGVLNDDTTYRRIQEAKRARTGSAVVAVSDLVDADAIVPEYVERLNRIIERTGAECVLSSSWRKARELSEIQATTKRPASDSLSITCMYRTGCKTSMSSGPSACWVGDEF